MKKTVLFTLSIGLAVYSCTTIHPVSNPALAVKTTAEHVQNGKRLTSMVCGPCHYNNETKAYTGGQMKDVPGILGTIIAHNLTQDPKVGIADYSPGQIMTLVRTGVTKEGRYLPFMLRPNMADEDLQDIIAFLKSNDEEVKANPTDPGKSKYSLIAKMALNKEPLPMPKEKIERPDENNKVATGKYLVDNLACYHCHSKSFTSIDEVHPEKSKGFMGGGNPMKTLDGSTIKSANLTFDETGIKEYSATDFRKALKEGINKQNQILRYPMQMYSRMTDQEADAIFEYLKTLPAIKNKVKR